jgi:putative protease
MDKIRIKAPVRSKESAKFMIKAGADEIYLGVGVEGLEHLSFSGRGTKSQWDDEPTHVQSFDELSEIIEMAHANNVAVDFTANMPQIPGDARGRQLYFNHIEKAAKAGVDAIIIADYAALKLVDEMDLGVKLYTSTFIDTLNIGQVKFLKELGANRILLPNQLTPEEMSEMTIDKSLEYEVFGHFGCANLNGTCFLIHGMSEGISLGMPCRSIYNVESEAYTKKNISFLDAGEDCSLCYIQQLMDAGINSLKIVGRALSHHYISAITRIYRKAIDAYYEGLPVDEIKKKAFKLVPHWSKSYCESNRCKYGDTKVTQHFV